MKRLKPLYFNNKLEGSDDFKASSGWLQKFKKRHGIRQLEIQVESLSRDSVAAANYKISFLKMIEDEGYSKDDV